MNSLALRARAEIFVELAMSISVRRDPRHIGRFGRSIDADLGGG
jgi:hypothetical protein